MIQITEKLERVELEYFGYKIAIPSKVYHTFTENLFVVKTQNKWGKNQLQTEVISEQIKVEEINWFDFNLIYNKHIPNYNDSERKRIDIERLLKNCEWLSLQKN